MPIRAIVEIIYGITRLDSVLPPEPLALSILKINKPITIKYTAKTAQPSQLAGVHPHPYVLFLNQSFFI
jgi:hypothetical protein